MLLKVSGSNSSTSMAARFLTLKRCPSRGNYLEPRNNRRLLGTLLRICLQLKPLNSTSAAEAILRVIPDENRRETLDGLPPLYETEQKSLGPR